MKNVYLLILLDLILAGEHDPVRAQESKSDPVARQAVFSPEGVAFFEKRIRPVLVQKCYSCHSAKAEKVKAELYLDSRERILKGGESGPAIIPGDPAKSLLIKAIRRLNDDLEMPPKVGDRLTSEQIADFVTWVKMGAPDPRATDVTASSHEKPPIDFEKARRFWSLRPPIEPPLPSVKAKEWPWSPIDRFILAKLEAMGLRPVADADKRTLIRRVTFDLTGLPPTPEEIDAFLKDETLNAFAKVVDRLLASTAYGERWGRHWLDIVRYADTAGDTSDYPVPQAFKYRDYVIDSFNRDKPYDQFLREQIAGDLLPYRNESEKREHIIATGYLAISRRFFSIEEGTRHLVLEDTIDNLGRAILGMTVNCARCHDHKFDPVTNDDYYALYGILDSTRYPFPGIEEDKVPRDFVPLIPQEQVDALLKPHREQFAKLDAEVKRLEAEREATAKAVADGEEALNEAAANRTKGVEEAKKAEEVRRTREAQELQDASVRQNVPAEIEADAEARRKFEEQESALVQTRRMVVRLNAEMRRIEAEKAAIIRIRIEKEKFKEIEERVAHSTQKLAGFKGAIKEAIRKREKIAKGMPTFDCAYAVAEGSNPHNARVHLKGDPKNPGKEVPRRFLEVLGGEALPKGEKGSGRRQLAQWLTDPNNPLPARVMVNRIWLYHFGRGIVQTPSDFGVRGRAPTHPELLDYLTRRFVESGWSIKAMHRLLVLSRTYQLASRGNGENANVDPNNDYLWKASRRRLEAEAIRDALLATSGALDRSRGGPHPFPPASAWEFTPHKPFIADYATNRRSVYVMMQRIRRQPFFGIFDGPDPNACTPERNVSTTPLQALYFMNDPFVHQQAHRFAERLMMARTDDGLRLDLAYQLAFGRLPSLSERSAAESYFGKLREKFRDMGSPDDQSASKAWESYARALFRSNEFVYVD